MFHKKQAFTVPTELYSYLKIYTLEQGIKPYNIIFPIAERAIQKQLAIICDYLGIDGVSTHSFRKFYATEIYVNNNYDIMLVKELLQHSTMAVTQSYIRIGSKTKEKAITQHLCLI